MVLQKYLFTIMSPYCKYFSDIHHHESQLAAQDMEIIDEDLGLGILPGTTPLK